jgi:hypothetical protein
MNLEPLAELLEEIIKENLSKKQYKFGFKKYQGVGNKVASGTLRNSIQTVIIGDKIEIMMEDYGRYVQKGRKGKPPQSRKGKKRGQGKKPPTPFILSLMKWIKARKLKGRDKKGRFISNESFAFAIRANIFKFGVRPADFVYLSIEDLIKDKRINDLLEESAMTDLIKAITGKI